MSDSDTDTDDYIRPLIIEVPRRELSEGVTPTPPSLLWPGEDEAVRRGCTCPLEENVKRLIAGVSLPKLSLTCRVHNKVCQAELCDHSSHIGDHFRCEHCTNVLHLCVVCEAVYLEDGDDPSLYGWKYVESDPIVKGWRCTRCA